jgi:hypothetical protein
VLVLVGGQILLLVGRGLRLLILVPVVLLMCGTLYSLMPALVGGKPRILLVTGGKRVVYHMCVVAVVSMEGVRLPMVIMGA